VLEDNELNMFIASTLLQTWMPNVKVVEMFNAFDALSFLERESVDLIFVDIELPQKNGFTVTRRIREMEQLAQKVFATPVIALTARSVEHTRELGLAAGMNDFLTKPIDADELKRVLTRFLSRTNNVS
jgi:CheY-like chemotaxis protein